MHLVVNRKIFAEIQFTVRAPNQKLDVDERKLTRRVLDKSVGRSSVEEMFELIDLSDY